MVAAANGLNFAPAFTWLRRLLLLTLGVWIMWSGFGKLSDLAYFRQTLVGQGIFDTETAAWLSVVVAGSEILVGCAAAAALVSGRCDRGLLLVAGIVFLFTLYASVLILNPPPNPVGCGCGPGRALVASWSGIAIRNGLLCGVCALFAAVSSRGPQPSS